MGWVIPWMAPRPRRNAAALTHRGHVPPFPIPAPAAPATPEAAAPQRVPRRVGTLTTPHIKLMRTFYGWDIWQASVGEGLVAYGCSAFEAWAAARTWFDNTGRWDADTLRAFARSAADKTLVRSMERCKSAGWRPGSRTVVVREEF